MVTGNRTDWCMHGHCPRACMHAWIYADTRPHHHNTLKKIHHTLYYVYYLPVTRHPRCSRCGSGRRGTWHVRARPAARRGGRTARRGARPSGTDPRARPSCRPARAPSCPGACSPWTRAPRSAPPWTGARRSRPPGPPAPSAPRTPAAREAAAAALALALAAAEAEAEARRAPAGPGPTGTGAPPRRRRWDPCSRSLVCVWGLPTSCLGLAQLGSPCVRRLLYIAATVLQGKARRLARSLVNLRRTAL